MTPKNTSQETPAPPSSSEMGSVLTQDVPPPPKKEETIDLNTVFPEEDQNLNDLFPEQDLRALLKKIRKNKSDLSKMNDRFHDDHILDDSIDEDAPDTPDSD